MKSTISLLALLLLPYFLISQTFVPDDAFEQKLIDLGYDSGPLDDFVPTANINTVTNLNINGDPISDLTGIEDFTALEMFTIRNTNITQLDVTSNSQLIILNCNSNNLNSVILTGLVTVLIFAVGTKSSRGPLS